MGVEGKRITVLRMISRQSIHYPIYILYPISCTLYSLWNGSSDPHTIQTRLITASVTELNSTIWLYLRKKGGEKDRERKGRRKGRRKSKKGKKESKKGNKKESKKGKKERNAAHIECFPILHNVMSYSWYRQPHTPAISIVSTLSTRGKPQHTIVTSTYCAKNIHPKPKVMIAQITNSAAISGNAVKYNNRFIIKGGGNMYTRACVSAE